MSNVKLRVLLACEESQAVCKEFRALGHQAWSCDLEPCSGGHPEWHVQADVLRILNWRKWDLIIAFPPCTHLAVSGARHFAEKRKDGRQQEAIDFFMRFTELGCPWAIENPIGIMSSFYRKPDQIIQPWWFGHGETKATCLWLNGLPKLVPTNIVSGREARIHKMAPSPERAKLRYLLRRLQVNQLSSLNRASAFFIRSRSLAMSSSLISVSFILILSLNDARCGEV